MIYIIAVFRSRNETLYLANMLIALGNRVSVINTPKEVGQACGISVRFEEKILPIAKKCLSTKPFRAFAGFYRITQNQSNLKIERIS